MDEHAPGPGSPDPVPPDGAVSGSPVLEPDSPIAAATEPVDPPPVQLATAEPPGRRRVSGRVSVVAALIGVLAIAGVGAFGYSLTQDLAATRSTLSTTEGDLAARTKTLDATTGTLGERTTALTAAKGSHADLDSKIEELSTEVAGQTKCVQLQTAALAELGRIEQLQTENFNRTTEKSAWAKAEAARGKAISAALDDYYQAYSKAFQGATSVAKTWAAKGRTAEATMTSEEKKQAAEIKIVDQKADEIAAALDALEKQLTEADAACAEVAP